MNAVVFVYQGLMILVAAAAVLSCLVPGLAMLFFPQKAFRTRAKPRWIGVPVLAFGLLCLYLLAPLFRQL